jgi:lipopolysaccharide transport system permease protein/teichoic acid transport system permease protein
MLGLLWAFIQPLAMMTILWGVFSYGLKAKAQEPGISFIAWFFAASIAWNFFQDTTLMTSNAITEYAFLVKKVDFKVRLLPVVKILSALVLHMIFILILVAILLLNGIMPSWHWLQVSYYMSCAVILSLGLGWLLSSLSVFTRDIGQIVGIIIQFGFWVTPIIWNWRISIPAKWQWVIKLNPVFYITEGYRNSFVYNLPISAQGLHSTLYFWLFTSVLLVLGHKVFMQLKPHFGDVL